MTHATYHLLPGDGPRSCPMVERPGIAARQVRGALHFDARETWKLHKLSLAELATHRATFPDTYDRSRGPIGYASVDTSAFALPDALPWTADDMQAHELTGLEPAHTRMLERAADAFLRDHACRVTRQDVWNRGHLQVVPDRAAYRGIVRFKRAAPVTYGGTPRRVNGRMVPGEPAEVLTFPGDLTHSDAALYAANVLGIPAGETVVKLYSTTTRVRGARTLKSLVTHDEGRTWKLVPITDSDGVKRRVSGPTTVKRARVLIGCRGAGWHGTAHDAVDTVKADRKARRRTTTGKRGPARSGWSLADRSLTRAWQNADAGQRTAAETLTAILATSTRGVVLDLGEHFHAVTPDGSTVYLADEQGTPRTRTFTLQAFARRAALAREDIA